MSHACMHMHTHAHTLYSNIVLLYPKVTLLRDHKRNTWIRHQTGINDSIDVIKKGIRGWAGTLRDSPITDGLKE